MASRIELVRINKGKEMEAIPLDERYKYSPQNLFTNGIKTREGRFRCIKTDGTHALSLRRQATMTDVLRMRLLKKDINGVNAWFTLKEDEINEAKVSFAEGFRRRTIYRFIP